MLQLVGDLIFIMVHLIIQEELNISKHILSDTCVSEELANQNTQGIQRLFWLPNATLVAKLPLRLQPKQDTIFSAEKDCSLEIHCFHHNPAVWTVGGEI